jgi:chromosomal replication initiation ATPase DnaA
MMKLFYDKIKVEFTLVETEEEEYLKKLNMEKTNLLIMWETEFYTIYIQDKASLGIKRFWREFFQNTDRLILSLI